MTPQVDVGWYESSSEEIFDRMAIARELRLLFLGVTWVATLVTVLVAVTLLWPKWQEYRAVQQLVAVLPLDQEPDPLDERIRVVKSFAGGRAAVPQLVEELITGDEHVSWRARYALCQIGPAATEPLIKILDDETEAVSARIAAAWALGPMKDTAALPTLVNALRDGDAGIRAKSAWALRFHAPDSKVAVPLLRRLLRDENQKVRRSAAFALAELGPEAKAALAELIELLRDTDSDTVVFAMTALERMGPDSKEAVPALVQLIQLGWLHDEAVETLSKIDTETAKLYGFGQKDDSLP